MSDIQSPLKRRFFFFLLIAMSILVILVTRRFLMPVLLAAISAGLLYPLDRRIMDRFPKHRNLTAALTLLLFCLIIMVPVLLLGYLVVDNIIDLTSLLNRNAANIRAWIVDIEGSIRALPVLQNLQTMNFINADKLVNLLERSASGVLESLSNIAGNTARFFFMFFIFLYCLYFFIRDGSRILRKITDAIPLDEEDRQAVIKKFLSVTRATVKSTAIIGCIQGIIGSLLFFALGIPAPVLWGVAFFILAAVPGLGPVVIWLPATVILFILGHTSKAILMLIIGGAVIPLADYLLRPRLVGQDTQLHPVLVFLGVLGGVALFGLAGLLFGPLAMSLAVTVWGMYTRIYGGELNER